MNKYKIEGNTDFFAELYKSLDIEDSDEDDKNKCLITHEELTDKYIELNCGHKFNYIPLFHDLVNHKKKFNLLEDQSGRLNTDEIRCPYCRKKQKGVLPYYEDLVAEKINGVNFYDPTVKYYKSNYVYECNKCEYMYPNENYNPNEPESYTNKPYLDNHKCKLNGSQINDYNYKTQLSTNYGDTKYYCYQHKKTMIKKYKLEAINKEKIAKKQAKELAKAEVKATKEKEKDELKAAKMKEKEEAKIAKKKSIENTVLGPLIIENQTENIGCIQILKTGPNKGKPCGCKKFENNLCKRHSNLI